MDRDVHDSLPRPPSRLELQRKTKVELRRQLKEGAIRRADRDRQLTAEWDHLSAEVWARLDREEETMTAVDTAIKISLALVEL
jgi:hypothetical protein